MFFKLGTFSGRRYGTKNYFFIDLVSVSDQIHELLYGQSTYGDLLVFGKEKFYCYRCSSISLCYTYFYLLSFRDL